jgi:hypothetical protein
MRTNTRRERIIKARTEKLKERVQIAKHRKWSFISMAVIAICVVLLYYSGGIMAVLNVLK